METIKLSQLNTDTVIAYGSKNILACAERLFYDIYEGKRKRKAIAIIGDKNYEIEYDVKENKLKRLWFVVIIIKKLIKMLVYARLVAMII